MRMLTQWLTEHEKTLVYEQALATLERVGMRFQGSNQLGQLAAAGAHVDGPVVRFPPEMVQRAVELSPRRVLLAGATPESDVLLNEGERTHFSMSGCVAKTLDYHTGERRPSTLRHPGFSGDSSV